MVVANADGTPGVPVDARGGVQMPRLADLGGGLLTAGIVLGLIAIGLVAWAAALVGGLVIAGIGYALVRAGLASFRPQDLKPRQTIETLKEDARWLRTQAR